MDKPISVGDLVVCVRDCCGVRLGWVFIVGKLVPKHQFEVWTCKFCGVELPGPTGVDACDGKHGAMLDRVKRIPPLDETDDVKNDAEITA